MEPELVELTAKVIEHTDRLALDILMMSEADQVMVSQKELIRFRSALRTSIKMLQVLTPENMFKLDNAEVLIDEIKDELDYREKKEA